MKKFRRKALPALTMLVIAILCLTGVTYAWFTEGSQVAVNDIQITVTSSKGGMLISSTQDGSYTNSFSASTESATLNPVSTAGERINKQESGKAVKGSDSMNFFIGEIDNATGTSLKEAKAVSSKSGNYIQFELWFESLDSSDKNVYFDYTNADEMFVLGTGESISDSASALRIAFVYQGTKLSKSSTAWVDYYDQTTTYEKFTGSAFATGTKYYEEKFVLASDGGGVYDSAKTYFTVSDGVYSQVASNDAAAFDTYYLKVANEYLLTSDTAMKSGKDYFTKSVTNNVDKALTDTSNPIVIVEPRHNVHTASGLDSATASQTQVYYGLKHGFDVVANNTDATDYHLAQSLPILPGSAPTGEAALIYKQVSTKTVNQCMSNATSDKTALFQLHQGYTHVTVYIWIEGQDIDCSNAIANLVSKINLKFTAENVSK